METLQGNITSESETNIDTAFLDVLTGNQQSSWTAEISLNNQLIQFKLDTGAEVTVVSDRVFTSLQNTKIQKTTRVLMGPAQQKLEFLGQFHDYFSYKTETCQDTVFIVKGLKTCKEHDDQLLKVMQRLKSEGVTLNMEKCEFTKVRYSF